MQENVNALRTVWMGQAPTSLARSYPFKYGCDARLLRLSYRLRLQDDGFQDDAFEKGCFEDDRGCDVDALHLASKR
ncbi:hypothetical protein [Fibrobacter sp.]|uniref:hypothetical protein n=1 Tax=Fibrobacter sp. TaxID=35828 RepID=UPI0025BDE344|nr:hypothetical protein [Fibrobacter sp.]MBR3072939.1 hypothetical protein [Fibrobacter sp.]